MLTYELCKTVHQFNKMPIPPENMQKLLEIAADYGRVKNYVYQKYGGISGLSKIYPGYTVQNEMTRTDLRSELGLPSVYFYLAVFDALGDIKNQWTQVKGKILSNINKHIGFTDEEKHYLRFVLKVGACLEEILNRRDAMLPTDLRNPHEFFSETPDLKKLNNYIRRQVRRYLCKPHSEAEPGFSIAERAYRYADHGIYISVKEKRKRVFVELTDNNRYKRQIYIKLYPEKNSLELFVPVSEKIKRNREYTNEIGLSMGLGVMFTTDSGHKYGEKYEEYHKQIYRYIMAGNDAYRRERRNNPGRKKYNTGKKRLESTLHSYVNYELNRMLEEERPAVIYLPKLPQNPSAGVNHEINTSMTLWQKGYIRKRLAYKCIQRSIALVEVPGKGISTECCACGEKGKKSYGIFSCPSCGLKIPEKMNTAKNAVKRKESGRIKAKVSIQ